MLRTVSEVRSALAGADSIGFVPTMGAFHEGHLELMRRSLSECRTTVVSLFVNPIQFGSSEDFDKYPRDEENDFEMASTLGVDCLFAPDRNEILLGQQSTVHVSGVTERWEGTSRPGHFDGVATIVLKLFNIVRPNVAYFGLKDLQQCAVVRTMVTDFNLDTHIETVNTVREPSGLALSSRNRRLSSQGLETAPILYKSISSSFIRIMEHGAQIEKELHDSKSILESSGFAVDYIAFLDPVTMLPLDRPAKNARIVAAVNLEGVRLIDNVGS